MYLYPDNPTVCVMLWLVTLLGCLVVTVLAFLMILTVYDRFFKLYLYAALSPAATTRTKRVIRCGFTQK